MVRRCLTALLAALLIVQGLVPIAAAAAGEDGDGGGGRTMRVAATSLNMRAGAGTEHPVLQSLLQGTLVTVVEERGEWARVQVADGTVGWVALKYLESAQPSPAAPAPRPPAGQTPVREPRPDVARPAGTGGGGGSTLRSIAKWGCLAGALVAGGLWYTEHSSGNDAYEEYKDLYNAGDVDAAEVKYGETTDHDDKAQTYAIAGGMLLGLFALQQFVLTGGDEDRAGLDAGFGLPALSLDPRGGEVRAVLLRLSF